MGIRLLKSQFLAALSFALLAGCSTDSGVISKKEANQQISSSSQSQIQRLNEEPALSRHHQDEAEQPIAAKEDRQSDRFVAVIPPAQKKKQEPNKRQETEKKEKREKKKHEKKKTRKKKE